MKKDAVIIKQILITFQLVQVTNQERALNLPQCNYTRFHKNRSNALTTHLYATNPQQTTLSPAHRSSNQPIINLENPPPKIIKHNAWIIYQHPMSITKWHSYFIIHNHTTPVNSQHGTLKTKQPTALTIHQHTP